MVNPARPRVPVIDGLRGAAILLVVLYHVWEKTRFAFDVTVGKLHVDAHVLVQAGLLGVELFFFVSGFCLMLPYAAWICGRASFQSWREYASRRFWKIVPSYYVALLAFSLWFPFNAQPGIARAHDVALHAFFLHSFNPNAFASLNGNFWSLAVEVQFYAIFPLIVWGFARKPLLTAAAVTLTGLSYSAALANTGMDQSFTWAYQLPSFLPLFGIGSLCAYVYQRWIVDAQLSRSARSEMNVVAFAAMCALGYVFEQMNRAGGGPPVWSWQNGHRLEIALLLAVFTLAAACGTRAFQYAVGNRLLRFYSDISYNMYLWNAGIVAFVAMNWRVDGPWRGPLFCAVVLVATTSFGVVFTHVLERPLMRYRTSIFKRLAELAGGRKAAPEVLVQSA